MNTGSSRALPGLTLLLTYCLLLLPGPGRAETVLYDQYEINGHPGYLTAGEVNHGLQRVLLVVPGFDTRNDSLPLDELQGDFADLAGFMSAYG